MLRALFPGDWGLRHPLLHEDRAGRNGQDLPPGGSASEGEAEERDRICTEGIPEGLQPPAWPEESGDHFGERLELAGGGGAGAESAGFSDTIEDANSNTEAANFTIQTLTLQNSARRNRQQIGK